MDLDRILQPPEPTADALTLPLQPFVQPGPAYGMDNTGQIKPHGMEATLTVTFWKEEVTMVYSVGVNGCTVARRENDRLVNGTKMLNTAVSNITRTERDELLKLEKTRHIVTTGPQFLKGVW
jgi:hypothetical protein